MATLPTPLYKPLNSSSKQIRLLQLLPNENLPGPQPPWYELANIQCKLIYANLDSVPDYEALSYTWGSSGSDVNIEVDGQVISVRSNLAYALAALRRSTPRILWVDAISIDQENVEERNHQVGQMGEIYRKAQQVLTWLGRPSDSFGSVVTSAIWLAKRLAEISPSTELPLAPEFDQEDENSQLYHSRSIADQRHNLQHKWKELLELKQLLESKERQVLDKRRKLEKQLAKEDQRERDEQMAQETKLEEHLLESPEPLEQLELSEDQELFESQKSPENQALEHQEDLKRIAQQERKTERSQKQVLREQRLEQQRQDIRLREQNLRALLYTFEQSVQNEKLEVERRRLIIKAERRRIVEKWQKMKTVESLQWLEQVIEMPTNWPKMKIEGPLKELELVVDRRIFRIRHVWREHLLCLTSICDLPYWTRLWIVPEVLLARKVVICFGDNKRTTCDWDLWARARQNLEKLPTIWELPSLIAGSITSIKQSLLFQLDKRRQHQDQGWPLHDLLITTQKSLCENPRDKIYGLLGLADDIRSEDLGIDYKKSLYEVYQDVMHWYCNCHNGRREGFPSLVCFSQIVQISLQGHSIPQARDSQPNLALLDRRFFQKSPEIFHTAGVLMGCILPLEKVLDDNNLINVRQQDWLYTMTEYLHSSRGTKTKDALETQLKYLDSVDTTWCISDTSVAYATTGGDVPEFEDGCVARRPQTRRQPLKERTQFFMAASGNFGVASSSIRENDILCQFKDCDTGVILRPTGHHYSLVSKAILFPWPSGDSLELTRGVDILNDSNSELTVEDELLIDVVLDGPTLQDITRPFELTDKHRYREPFCVQNSAFGWYEFINHGHDISVVDKVQNSPQCQSGTLLQTYSLWRVMSSNWMHFWTQPLKRLWVLIALFSYLNNALKCGSSVLETAVFAHIKAFLTPLNYLNNLPRRTYTVAPRRKRLALAAMG